MEYHSRPRFAGIAASAVCCVFLTAHAQRPSLPPPGLPEAPHTTLAPSEASLRATLASNPDDLAANRQIAELLENTGRLHAAITYRRRILTLSTDPDPDRDSAQLELAVALVENRDYDEAITLLQDLLHRTPTSSKANDELGTAYARKEDFISAFAAYKAAAQLDPADADAQISAAKSLITLLRYTEAEPFLAAAATAKAPAFDLHLLHGMVDRHTGREAQAITELTQAVHLQPNDAEANLELAEALRSTGKGRESIASFQKAATLKPTAAIYFRLVTLYRSLGMHAEEQAATQKLTELREAETRDTQIAALRSQAERATQQGDHAAAAAAYQSALALRPNDPDLLFAAALVQAHLQHPDAESSLLHRALAAAPNHAATLGELGTLEAQSGNLTQAKQYLAQALQADPQQPLALNSMAVLIARGGDLNRAQDLLQQAIESDPSYHEAYRNLGLIYASTNRPRQAEQAIRRSVTLDPKDSLGWVALGELYLNQQKASAAAEAFRNAVNTAPENTATRLLLARSLIMGGDKAAALREVNLILQQSPHSAEARQLKANIASSTSSSTP